MYVSVLPAGAENSMIIQRRGRWIVSQNGRVHKFNSKLDAENFLGIDNAEEKSKEFEAKTGWSDGVQQTKAYKESPQKKSYRGGEGWDKD